MFMASHVRISGAVRAGKRLFGSQRTRAGATWRSTA